MESRKVALAIDMASSYGPGLLRGIGEYARLQGGWTFVGEPGEIRGKVDGILALVRSPVQAARLRARRIPFVDLDYAIPGLRKSWGVCHDEAAVATLAARHLRDCGLRSFGWAGWERDASTRTWWETERREAYLAVLRREGFEASVFPRPARGDETAALLDWVRSLPRPCGILAANDLRGRHVIEAARAAGKRVPEDVAVIGVDDDPVLCELSHPPLSSIALDTRSIGFEGAALLERLMAGLSAPRRLRMLPPLGVTARRSTDLLAVADAPIAAALRFMKAALGRPIGVTELAAAAGLARRSFEARFRRELGRSPYQELLKMRCDRVADLLTGTDWPLKRIASACGFAYVEQMHAAFRGRFGATPARFRRGREGPAE
jgi:LacI family transcriptional regulator